MGEKLRRITKGPLWTHDRMEIFRDGKWQRLAEDTATQMLLDGTGWLSAIWTFEPPDASE